MPERIPALPRAFFNNIGDMSMPEIAYVVASLFFSDALPASGIKSITDQAFSFNAPFVEIGPNTYVLELFHGPSLTFKDYGARFVARLIAALDRERNRPGRTVLVATTGNSGAATANGLSGLPGVQVVVLYPKNTLTRMQIAQFATLGANVHAVEVDGTVEDCKDLMREAMSYKALSYLNLTTANSINIGRLIPQIVFALHSYGQLRAAEVPNADEAVYSIPCGNYSNLVAAMMAVAMGMPAGAIIGACNVNDSLNAILQGRSAGHTPVKTASPSLDITNPTCARRLEYLRKMSPAAAAVLKAAAPVSDTLMAQTITELRSHSGYTIDPHGAVALAALNEFVTDAPRVVYTTGHPAKSLDTMTAITGSPIELPVQFNRFIGARRQTRHIPATLAALRRLLITL